VYFEGTNVLVKIDGTDSVFAGRGGVLFSAHYDSVSTAPGATDDGMGVATVLQLVEWFAKNRGRRTAVFNINNGEEDFLNGAHASVYFAFQSHPQYSMSLLGSSSTHGQISPTHFSISKVLPQEGVWQLFLQNSKSPHPPPPSRPLVFRSSSLPPLRSFLPPHVPHPHASVLSADAFARGAIRSDTDYSVYTGLHARAHSQVKTMQGLDYAFYKHRSRYHTKYDAMPYTEGGRRALWGMLEGAAGAGRALVDVPLNEEDALPIDVKKGGAGAVYFDRGCLFIYARASV